LTDWTNKLFFGDNLDVMRRHIGDESVDLVYLDPPFNSKADYNVLFKEVDGTPSASQFQAFTDFWHWDENSARAYHELVTGDKAPPALVDLLQGFERFLGHNDMFAYLVMMAPRLVELRRVLKPTGSIYLHCDPNASHYLKLVMDAVFGSKNFINEICWKRTTSSSSKKVANRYGSDHDIIYFYSKVSNFVFNQNYIPYSNEYIKERFNQEDKKGLYKDAQLKTYSKDKLEQLRQEGKLIVTSGGKYRYKMYLEEAPGVPVDDVWVDIFPVNAVARERLGYQTQKPQALLERIINVSSNEGDVVLDPFCGCGTTIAAAQALDRRWIGIDITYLAINLIKSRLADHFGEEATYEVHGEPRDWDSARELAQRTDMPRKEFELWALSLVHARPLGDPEKKGGGDRGIDGVLFFRDGKTEKTLTTRKIIVQVKSDLKPKVSHVRDLRGVMEREKADFGALILLYRAGERSEIHREAAGAGFYHSELMQRDYPRIQVLQVDALLEGRSRLDYPLVGRLDLLRHAGKIGKSGGQLKLE